MESFGGPLCFVNIALDVICGLWFGCGWLGALPCMLEVAVFGAGHKLFPQVLAGSVLGGRTLAAEHKCCHPPEHHTPLGASSPSSTSHGSLRGKERKSYLVLNNICSLQHWSTKLLLCMD